MAAAPNMGISGWSAQAFRSSTRSCAICRAVAGHRWLSLRPSTRKRARYPRVVKGSAYALGPPLGQALVMSICSARVGMAHDRHANPRLGPESL
jgi:hypothetical protein